MRPRACARVPDSVSHADQTDMFRGLDNVACAAQRLESDNAQGKWTAFAKVWEGLLERLSWQQCYTLALHHTAF